MLLLDTHALVWLMQGESDLGNRARREAEEALRRGQLAVSAFSFWELAMMQFKGRKPIVSDLEIWRRGILDFGVAEIPVGGDVAIAAWRLDGFHADPADRIMAATALRYNALLLTADRQILAWKGGLKCLDARK